MHIEIEGKSKNVKRKRIIKAAEFYASVLLTPRLSKSIDITIKLDKEEFKDSHYGGFCEWMDRRNKPREFLITLDKRMDEEIILIMLAHEMVHVKQHAKGELTDKGQHQRYNGVSYDTEEMEYWDFPWEIEAYGKEKGLYFRFLESEV